jgi:hypothetical protein
VRRKIVMENMTSLDLNFNISIEINNAKTADEYADDYFSCFESPIIYKKYSEKFELIEEKNIGEIEITYLHGSRAYDNDLDIVDICDSESQELYDYAYSIYSDGYINAKYNEMPKSNDVLILNKIQIEKPYQGKEFGIIISKKVINFWGYNCGAILIKPFPLQFSLEKNDSEKWKNRYLSEEFKLNAEMCRKKLLKYWKKLSPHCIAIKSDDCDILCIPQ